MFIHVHVVLLSFSNLQYQTLVNMLAGHQVLPGVIDNYYSPAFRNSALMILQKMLPLLFFYELN